MNLPRVVITGGGGDLAQALVASLSLADMDVIALGKYELDVTDSSQVKQYFAQLGEIDLLICNAGVTMDKPLARMGEGDWNHAMNVNLKGAFLCARDVARSMMKNKVGHIIFISSFSALQPPVGQANYAASKAALHGFMKSLANELGSRNIRVNVVMPGFLETKMTADLKNEIKDAALKKHQLGRFNTPEIVGDFITFLHQGMPHTSGQVFNLDSRILP